MSEDCCRYGAENNQNINENILPKAAAIYGDARKHVEKEQEDFNRLLSSQVKFYLKLCRFMLGKDYHIMILSVIKFIYQKSR